MKRMLSMLALLGTFFLLPLMAQAQKYTITIVPVEHATITASYGYGASATVVNSGDQVDRYTRLNIQVTADAGYVATHYTINGTEKPITSTYGDSEWVQGDMTISAKVVAVTPCTINITQPTEGGTLTVNRTKPYKVLNSGDKVDSGTTIRLSAKPAEGYDIDYWLIDGQKVKPFDDQSIRYGISHLVMKDVSVSVAFKNLSAQTLVPVTVVKPEHGTIELHKGTSIFDETLNSGDQVETGSEITMVIKADEGYKIDHWLINDKVEPKDDLFPLRKTITISEATTISAVLVESGYIVTYEQPANGTLTVKTVNPVADVPSGTRVKEQAPISIQATVNEGYEFKHYLINGEKRLPNDMQTLLTYYVAPKEVTAVTIEAVIEKKAEAKSYVVTIEEPQNATMTVKYGIFSSPTEVASGDEVPEGTELRVDLYLDEGYKLVHFLVNGQPTPSESQDYEGIKVVVTGPLTLSAVVEKEGATPAEKVQLSVQEEGAVGYATVKYQTPGSTTWEKPAESKNPTLDLPVGTKVRVEANITVSGATVAFTHNDNPVAADKLTDEGLTYEFTLEEPANIKVIFTEGAIGFYVYYDCDKHATITGTADGEPFESGAKLAAGAEVVLTVTPEEGYEVKDWLDDDFKLIPGTEGKNPYTFTVDGFAMVFAETQKKTTALIKVSSEGPTGCTLETTYLEPGGSGNPLKIFGEKRIPLGSDVTVKAKFTISGDYQVVYTNNGKPVPAEALSEDGFVYTFKANEDADIYAVFSEKPAPAVDYTVTLEASKGGTVTATVDLDPIESGAKVPAGSKVKVIATPDDGYEVDQWFIDDETIPTPETGYYYFTLNKDTKVKVTFRLSVAVEQPTQNQLVAYVTNGGTRLEVAGAAEGAEVRLYDYTGRLLLASTEHALDISALPAGSYIVLVGNYTTRIVK